MLGIILTLVISYVLGAIPFAILVTRLTKGVDVRDYGSRNAGATNVYRVAGLKIAILVGILDLAKGFAAVFWIAHALYGGELLTLLELQIIATIFVVLGHMYTIFAGFKGGKGVLAAAGAFLALMPLEVGMAMALFVIILILTRYVSLGSICAALLISLILIVKKYFLSFSVPPELLILSLAISAIVLFSHRSNIARLLKGTENKVGKRKS